MCNKLCTFTLTQKEFMHQHWYHCHTCRMVDGVGVCTVCARVCHRGHDVTYSKYGAFFCDCGAKEDGSCQVGVSSGFTVCFWGRAISSSASNMFSLIFVLCLKLTLPMLIFHGLFNSYHLANSFPLDPFVCQLLVSLVLSLSTCFFTLPCLLSTASLDFDCSYYVMCQQAEEQAWYFLHISIIMISIIPMQSLVCPCSNILIYLFIFYIISISLWWVTEDGKSRNCKEQRMRDLQQ